jgi:hypothetical protein
LAHGSEAAADSTFGGLFVTLSKTGVEGARTRLADQLDRDAYRRQISPVPISGHGWNLEASREGQASAVAKRQSLSLGSGSKVGSLGGIVLGEWLDLQSAFSRLVDRSQRYNGRLAVFGEFRQDLREVDGADRGTSCDCLHHLVSAILVLQQS